MKSIPLAFLFVLVIVVVSPQGAPGVNIDFGVLVDTFTQGDTAEVPVTVVTRNDPQVGLVVFEMAFPATSLSFTDAVLGGAVDVQGAKLNTQVRDDGDGEQKILRVEISSTSSINQGLLVTLSFEISQDIAANHDIQLENLIQSAKSLDGNDLAARGLSGSITSIEFIPACFFYMH